MKFKIFAGLKGRFEGANYLGVKEFDSLEDAVQYARAEARDLYEVHTGLYGIKSIGTIMQEEGVKQELAEQIWLDGMSLMLDYKAELIN